MLRYLLVTFLLSTGVLVSPANASTGDPIFFRNGDREPVKFSWSIPKSHANYVVVTNNPHGKEVFFVYNNTQTNLGSAYKDRVKNLIFNHGNVSFALENITKNDEGNYTCHEGERGPLIPDCGQTLHYLSSPVVRINSSEKVTGTPGENLTLRCLVESASPDVPSQGYSWTFSPSGSRSVQTLKETGDTLTLDPLTTNSSGQYRCQARNDQDFKGRIPPGNATISLKVHTSPVVRINSSEKVTGTPGENLTLRCLVESASPDVPSQGYSWTFSPSGSSSVQTLKETGDTLTLDPLTKNSSGQYTCQARNDQDFKGRIPPGNATISLKVHSKQYNGHHTTSSPTSLSSSSSSDNRLAVGLGVGLPIGCIIITAVAVIVVAKRKGKCCFQPSGGVPHPVRTKEQHELLDRS